MNIGAIGANPLLFLNSRAQSGGLSDQSFAPSANAAANSAGPLSILPSSSAVQLSFENVIALQSLADPEIAAIQPMSAEDTFLAEARKSPMERMREQVLGELGLTEESLAQMPAEDRRVAEEKIRALIEEKIRQAMDAGDEAPGSNSAILETLIGV